MKKIRNIFVLTTLIVAIFSTAVYGENSKELNEIEIQEGIKSIYMGGEVESFTFPNGSIFNKTLAEFMIESFTQPKIEKINDVVTVMSGFSIENTVIIEGEEGIIVWDTGHDMATGEIKYNDIREKITDKPIKAIIYSHNHYAEGTGAFLTEGTDGEVEILAHPYLDKNVKTTNLSMLPSYNINAGQHFGMLLPSNGPDAGIGNVLSNTSYSGYIAPTKIVNHGEEMEIDGIKMKFFHTPSDTDDSITLWLPEYETVITNSVWSSFPNMYTLRGSTFRDPATWIDGIDIIRELNPKYLVLEHGQPTVTRERSYELATNYRDAISFVYNQSIRGINEGLRPDEIAENIKLPQHLVDEPYLVQTYGNINHHIKGIYRGLIGWFDQDAASMNPVSIEVRSQKIIEGFGGKWKVIGAASEALENKEYSWAAELITHILNIEPENKFAREIKAEALREMAYVTPAYSERNYYLTQALELEGKIQIEKLLDQIEIGNNKEKLALIPEGSFIKLLESKIDPEKSGNIDETISIKFIDSNKEFGLAVRKGIAEYISQKPLNTKLSIEVTREIWVGISLGKVNIEDAIKNGLVKVNGDVNEVIEFMSSFEL